MLSDARRALSALIAANPLSPPSAATAGHARVYVAFDILYRMLRHLRYDVQYVRNFTDIDDKIIARANERGEDPLALSRWFIEEFHTVGGQPS